MGAVWGKVWHDWSGLALTGKAPALSGGMGADVADIKILLLRGVNVSGANRLPMAEFREMLAEFGLKNVDTHIQSGNAVFHDPGVEGLTDKIAGTPAD